MTDICFIYLPHPYLRRPKAQLPMGILMLAAMIQRDGRYSVIVRNYTAYTLENAIADLSEARIYGITITSMEIPYALEFAEAIKGKYPKAKVIVGGPGTLETDQLQSLFIDMIVAGEADNEICNIMECFFNGGCSLNSCYAIPPDDLDVLPYPARELLDGPMGGDVFAYNRRYEGDQSTVILSSRGCPYSCAFCAAPALASTVRYRSVDSVIGEMRYVIAKYGIRQFRFSDDLFTANKQRVLDMCKEIKWLDVAWRVSARVNPLDYDMLVAMKEAGCKELSFGIESFDDDVLSLLSKRATADDNVRALQLCDEVGMGARMLLMVGTPGQTPETIRLNKYYISKVPHTIVSCTAFVPIPGSDVWRDPDKYGVEILSRDMRDYNFYFFGPDGMTDMKPVIKLKDRPLDEFVHESTEFRQWLFERGDVNRG